MDQNLIVTNHLEKFYVLNHISRFKSLTATTFHRVCPAPAAHPGEKLTVPRRPMAESESVAQFGVMLDEDLNDVPRQGFHVDER